MIKSNIEKTLGYIMFRHANEEGTEDDWRNMGILVSNLMDFSEYMNMAIELSKTDVTKVVDLSSYVDKIRNVLMKEDLEDLIKQIMELFPSKKDLYIKVLKKVME